MLGMALVLAGAWWVLQGLGLVMWPAESTMLADRQWALRGALLAMLGLALTRVARRLGRRGD